MKVSTSRIDKTIGIAWRVNKVTNIYICTYLWLFMQSSIVSSYGTLQVDWKENRFTFLANTQIAYDSRRNDQDIFYSLKLDKLFTFLRISIVTELRVLGDFEAN